MSANSLQALLRFLSQDARVPLATAMAKVKDLQSEDLDTPEKLSKVKPDSIKSIFEDDKVAKQIIAAAKRVSKKRAAGDDALAPSPKKMRKDTKLFSDGPLPPAELEESLMLPCSEIDEEELRKIILHTNRAPLVLAFLVVLLKHTMPEQPLSSRLSLAQAYVSITSRSRAIYLGIENGKNAEDEGFGEGQPSVKVAGKDIKVLRRWGYEWKKDGSQPTEEDNGIGEENPALWALDLEALKRSGNDKQPAAVQVGNHSNLPVHTPQSARAYLLKSFDTAPDPGTSASKKPSAAAKAVEKEQNLAKLFRALDMLYDAWAKILTPGELDSKTWNWYVKVRPDVADGAAGWGGKNQLHVSKILDMRPGT